jgi:hypothetical protein
MIPRLIRTLAPLAAALACATAAAQDTAKVLDPHAYPPALQQSLQGLQNACRKAGGGDVSFAPDMVRALDLTGDGRTDYLIDLGDADCHDIAGFYCGTGGCELDIDVTLPNGGLRQIFSGPVLHYDILPGSGAKTIRFELHGAFCGLHGSQLCVKTHRITTKPFEFVVPQ